MRPPNASLLFTGRESTDQPQWAAAGRPDSFLPWRAARAVPDHVTAYSDPSTIPASA